MLSFYKTPVKILPGTYLLLAGIAKYETTFLCQNHSQVSYHYTKTSFIKLIIICQSFNELFFAAWNRRFFPLPYFRISKQKINYLSDVFYLIFICYIQIYHIFRNGMITFHFSFRSVHQSIDIFLSVTWLRKSLKALNITFHFWNCCNRII